MDWIKKNPEKFSLLLLSVALLAAAIFLVMTEQKFLSGFESVKTPPIPNNNLPPLGTASLQAAQDSLDKPATWEYDPEKQGSLFISQPYVVLDKSNGTPPGTLTFPFDLNVVFYPPVTNEWIRKYHLDLMDSNVINEDPDGDGFNNKEEFQAGTDPTDKNSHPPYTTKLFLEKFQPKPFRLIFHGKPDNKTYQIDTVDIQQPTQILEMGDTIANTNYKIVDYKEIHKTDENDMDKDLSELTVQNTESGKKVVLVVDVVTDDPDSFGLFKYFWKGAKEFKVKLDATFTLDPESDVTYKLTYIDKNGAKIVDSKTNKEIIVPLLNTGETFHWP